MYQLLFSIALDDLTGHFAIDKKTVKRKQSSVHIVHIV